jgi:serine/threonine protein kinase
MPRAPTTTAELINLIGKSGVVASEKLAGVADLPLPTDPRKAAAALVAQGIVTKFQATQLLSGRHKGFRIGAYTILDLLGRGGMGAVYLAEHLALHRKVAIKVLVPGKEDDQTLAMVRFQREARSAAALDHPNIVRIFDVARHIDVPYLVMEYVEGESLQEVIDRDGPFPYTTACEYIAQAASGLQHAYEKGFIHRDIKPGNLIRDNTGTIKILDMGLARSANPQDKLTAQLDGGAVVGTADFIAPEQAINHQSIDIRADIYSLGASLFCLIIGKPPFDGNTTQKLLQHQLRSAPSLISVDATLPKGLSDVVEKMLAKKPDDRFKTPAEVIGALTPWMASSARTLVGISCTSLVEDESLQATLSGIHRAPSSASLPNISAITDSNVFQQLESGRETAVMASSQTRRQSNDTTSAPIDNRKSRRWLFAAIAVLFLGAGAFGGWLAVSRAKKQDADANNTSSDNHSKQDKEQPKANANVSPNKATASNENKNGSEKVLYQFEMNGQKPFMQRLAMIKDPKDSGKLLVNLLAQGGSGEGPVGWKAQGGNKDSELEYFVESFDGKPALGIRNLQGPPSATLIAPAFETSTGTCGLKIEYQASLKEKKFVLKFKPADQRAAWEAATPRVTGEFWRVEDIIVDLKGAKGGSFEFHNLDGDPNAALRIHSVKVTAE